MSNSQTDSSSTAAEASPTGGDGSAPDVIESTSAAPSDESLTAVPHEPWGGAEAKDDQRLLIAVAVALAIHLLPVVVAVATVAFGLGGSSASLGVGDPAGEKGGVNVEIINATEFDRRYVSFTDGKDSSDSEATTPTSRRSSPATPPESQAPPVPAELPAPPPSKPSQLSAADIAEILENARLDIEGEVQATSRASMANQGQASAFVKGVLRKLKQSMPKSNGIKGTVVIGIILSEGGTVDWVGVLRKSNSPNLDQLVLERVRTTKFEASGGHIPPQERKFQITYHYE